MDKHNCPNCGAPIETAECPYCGTMFLDFGAIDIQNPGKPVFLRFRDGTRTILRKVVLTNATIRVDPGFVPFYADSRIYHIASQPSETIELEFQSVLTGDLLGVAVEDWRAAMHPEADKDIYDQIKEVIK